MRRAMAAAVGLVLGLCCLASALGGLAYFLYPLTARAETRPIVLVSSPRHGEQVEVGEPVTIQALARDEVSGVVRVELWVNGELQESQRSTLPGGVTPFPLLVNWEPLSPGTHTLSIRAFNADDARAYVSISVDAVVPPDTDGDGVADEDDSCPDEPGFGTSAGCPDGDGDGTPDAQDACPAQVGVPEEEGCPSATEGDEDGDGVADAEDACPDELGLPQHDGCPVPGDLDGDGVDEELDECPGEPGLSEQDGCPDLDGDGVRDGDDDCPDEPGLAELDGCPDTDRDGVPDPDDLRPDEPGRPEDRGAPNTGAIDSDGDGLTDDLDRCDYEEGLPQQDGCPPPGAGADANGDGIPDDVEQSGAGIPLWPPPGDGVRFVPLRGTVLDVEALEFQVFEQYDEIYCYIGLGGEGMERYGPFEPVGETHWDIAALLAGENSRRIMLPDGEDLEVRMECSAYGGISSEVTEPEEGFGEVEQHAVYVDLGSFTQEQPAEQWNGQPIMVPRSEGGTDGRFFRVTYRICTDSCEETALPPPHLWSHQMFGGQRWLEWTWTGDTASIDGFHARYDCYDRSTGVWWRGATVGTSPGQWSRSIEEFEPDYWHTCEWSVWAYRESDGVESPRSNIVVVDRPWPTGRTATVIFDMFFPPNTAARRGPIYGHFWANHEVLSYDGADPSYCDLNRVECGYYLQGEPGHVPGINVEGLFYDILELRRACDHCSYEAPSSNHVMVRLPEGDDLTMTFDLWEYHSEGEDTLLCRESCTIGYDDLEDTEAYYCPSYDVVAPCRARTIMHVGYSPGGG